MPSGMMDLLSTPTTFPLELDWEGKMEPSSPSAQSQQSYAEDPSNFEDDFYDFCNEPLFNNSTLIDFDVDLKPDPLVLLKAQDVVFPIVVGKQEKDPWYDDKLKLSSGGQSAQLGGYAPLPTVIEDGSFALQPEKSTNVAATEELLMEFDCVYGNVELNHLTPPQTPPQSSAFGGIVGNVITMQQQQEQQQQQQQQQQLFSVPLQQQQQQLLQPLYAAPLSNALPQQQQQQQQQLSFQGTGSEYYIVDEYATMTQLGGVVQQQQQELPGDIGAHSFSFSTEGYTPQQMNEVESIVRSLQMVEESLRDSQQQQQQVDDDDDSCGFSEAGSVESGDSSSLVSSSRSPVYSDSADSSYYGSRSKDRDDEDWSPTKTKKLNLSVGGGAVTKKRSTGTRPYGRGTEDKKSRKKEQNKNAATRYRQKKKAEIEEILTEENELRDRNEALQAKSADLGREIRCLKNLMRELLRGKGLM